MAVIGIPCTICREFKFVMNLDAYIRAEPADLYMSCSECLADEDVDLSHAIQTDHELIECIEAEYARAHQQIGENT